MVDYATLVLNNWKLKDPTLPLTLDNLSVIWSFTKSVAEEWFYIIHVVIENHGAEAMMAVQVLADQNALIGTANEHEITTLINSIKDALQILASSLKKMNAVLPQME